MSTHRLEIETVKRVWGSTSEAVWQQASNMLPAYNEPGPFGFPPMEISLQMIHDEMVTICEAAEAKRRVGMMISSHFSVYYLLEEQRVEVYHVRNTQPDELFLVFRKVKIEQPEMEEDWADKVAEDAARLLKKLKHKAI